MEPILGVAALWLAFAGTHIGLATRRVRGALVDRFGEWGFIGVFSLVASLTYAALVHFYARIASRVRPVWRSAGSSGCARS